MCGLASAHTHAEKMNQNVERSVHAHEPHMGHGRVDAYTDPHFSRLAEPHQ